LRESAVTNSTTGINNQRFIEMANTQKKPITRSREDYLRVIYELFRLNKAIRTSDIAERLGVTRASVSGMMTKLKNCGLIDKEKYGWISLTEVFYLFCVLHICVKLIDTYRRLYAKFRSCIYNPLHVTNSGYGWLGHN
jgi:predicted transcriptional regulator